MLEARKTLTRFGLLSLSLVIAACDPGTDDSADRQAPEYPGDDSGETNDSGVLDTGETFDDSGESMGETMDEGGDEGDTMDEGGDDEGCNDEGGHDDSGGETGMDSGGECSPADPFDLGRLEVFTPGQGEGVIVDCDTPSGYDVSSWRSTEMQPGALWVMGVYQTRGDHSGNNHPMGAGSVSWSRPGDNVLVLSAYEPTTWDVELVPGGELTAIVAIGYHNQIVNAPEGVDVQTYSYDEGACLIECGYSLPGQGGGCEGEDLVGLAEQITGRALTGFDGCYDATTFNY